MSAFLLVHSSGDFYEYEIIPGPLTDDVVLDEGDFAFALSPVVPETITLTLTTAEFAFIQGSIHGFVFMANEDKAMPKEQYEFLVRLKSKLDYLLSDEKFQEVD